MTRYKDAVTHSGLGEFISLLHERFATWSNHVNSETLSPDDTHWWSCIRPFIERGLDRLSSILGRTDVRFRDDKVNVSSTKHRVGSVHVDQLAMTYIGPGTHRADGPRHNNDHVDIKDIRIAPTHEELTTDIPPYLPYNIPGAPHPYPPSSMQHLLDVHFRLLREELM